MYEARTADDGSNSTLEGATGGEDGIRFMDGEIVGESVSMGGIRHAQIPGKRSNADRTASHSPGESAPAAPAVSA